jgi:outer membrane protein assembly factor BamA
VFSESTLRNLFDLDTGGWLSWYTKSDQYSRAKLNADLETLRSYYLTRGYLEFRSRLDPGGDLAGQAGHQHHRQHLRR